MVARSATKSGESEEETRDRRSGGEAVGEEDAPAEGQAEVEDHSGHRGEDGGEGAGESANLSQAFDVGGADEDEGEAGEEGRPGGEESAEHGARPRRKTARRRLPAGHEADELQHHDERAGGRLGEPQPVHRLRGGDPAELRDRRLIHVREHRVGAAERHERRLGEEQVELRRQAA